MRHRFSRFGILVVAALALTFPLAARAQLLFGPSLTRLATPNQEVHDLAIADAKGDGRLETIVPSCNSGTIEDPRIGVLPGHQGQLRGAEPDLDRRRAGGDGGFGPGSQVVTGAFGTAVIALGDCDGDGHADIVPFSSEGNCFVLRGKGDGSFGAPSAPIPVGDAIMAAATGDFAHGGGDVTSFRNLSQPAAATGPAALAFADGT